MPEPDHSSLSAWFAGPKAENGERFAALVRQVLEDHLYWRRNYFPEDGVVLGAAERHAQTPWHDRFEDRLLELLAALKSDVPFHSPRYAAHMIAEQTLPSIAGYFAAMLYNPNNVSGEAAPVTVRLELEAAGMIAAMLGHDPATGWAHLTGGGTVANFEALWAARAALYLPLAVGEAAGQLGVEDPFGDAGPAERLGLAPLAKLEGMRRYFQACAQAHGEGPATAARARAALRHSRYDAQVQGMAALRDAVGGRPLLLVPETAHYCLPKAAGLLGLGRAQVRRVAVDARFRLDPGALEEELEAVERSGDHVLAVVSVIGTTEEGAVDPFDHIVRLRDERAAQGRPSFWLHADAAYGGYLRTTILPRREGLGVPRTTTHVAGREVELELELPVGDTCDALARLGEADSIVVDPHKLGYIPYPAGALSFRSDLVKPLLRQEAPYIGEAATGPEAERREPGVGMYILEGSKPGAAAAAVWLSHATIPLDNSGHGQLVRQGIRDACELYALLTHWPKLGEAHGVRAVPLAPPQSNILCYCFAPAAGGRTLAELNQANREIYRRFSIAQDHRVHVYDQDFFVSRTVLSPDHYRASTVAPMLEALGASAEEYEREGIFLLRSVLMNPWYGAAKRRGKHFLAELVGALYVAAGEQLA